jgi:glycosyltransferase involved in cell wall biosynthesis
MRIAILTPAFYQAAKEISGEDVIIYGGSEKYTVDFVRFLQSRGHSVTIYQYINNTVNGKRVNCGQITKYYDGIPFILLPDTRWEYNTNPLLNMQFNECFVGNYDLAIYWTTYCTYPYTVNPSIAICHGIYWDYPYSDAVNGDENYRKEYMRRQLQGFASPDVVVSVDSNTKRVISAMQPGLERNIEPICNYVDTEKFKPLENKPINERLKVLFPRRLTLLRGCNEFIRASRECPEYDFLAVGQGSNQAAYEKQKAWGDTTENLRFTWKPMDGMEEIYQEADIGVVPTKSCEGLSLSLLECMACGLPTITTHAGGLTDATIDGYNTIIFNPVDNNLSELIKFLGSNPEAREVMGKRNREIAVECFDIEVWKNRWGNLLRQFGA